MKQKKENVREIIRSCELEKFNVRPYTGHENHAPLHPDIVAFVQLMLNKGYSKEDLLVAWGECRGIKLEANERGNEEKFEGKKFQAKFQGELTLIRATCCLFQHLSTADMELYYKTWLDTVRNAEVTKASATK